MAVQHFFVCPCGELVDHVIAQRTTSDGKEVYAYSDGAITGFMGRRLPGVPVAKPRTIEASHRERRAAQLFMGEVCLWNEADLGRLHKAARKAAANGGDAGDVRRGMKRSEAILIPFRVSEVSPAGAVVERFAVFRLGRLFHVAILWSRSRGYEMGHMVAGAMGRYDVFEASGFVFKNLAGVQAHLRSLLALKA